MAYKVIILYQLYMPSYFLGTFTEYPILSRECGLSYEEIAQKKGITKKIVEYRIRIALQVFKKRLKDYMYFFLFW